jgi:hypothetical protein
VGDGRARGKADRVAGPEATEMAVEPDIGFALDDIDELLLGAFGVRKPGSSLS